MFLGRVQSPEQFQAARLALLPGLWRERVRRQHAAKLSAVRSSDDERAANLWLLDLSERAEKIRIPLNLSDSDLCDMAREKAREAFALAECAPGRLVTLPALRERLANFVQGYGLTPPEPYRIGEDGKPRGIPDGPAVSRMTDHLWWRRRLRVAQGRAVEAEAISLGYVHRRAECYCSDLTHGRRQQQRQRNAKGLADTVAENLVTGQEFTLADLAERTVANPEIRRGELMTRIRGFEEIARGVGHAAEFVTVTCPSRMHAKRTGDGGKVEDNPKHDGTTPREAQGYLVKLWANARAKLHRLGVRVYGFRIAEPHHDGAPHWHLLLFMAADAVRRFRDVMRAYALREDGAEAGAVKNRVKFVAIDPAKGTAAGYIAKYVAKNIDGYSVQYDFEGNDAITSSQRVDAWASTWGIRQFQQIGGAPVGIWRELRRLGKEVQRGATLEAAREAADRAGWGDYVSIMGGPLVKRADMPLQAARTEPGYRYDYQAACMVPAALTRYGEAAAAQVWGVLDVGALVAVCTRRNQWEVKRGAKCTSVISEGSASLGVRTSSESGLSISCGSSVPAVNIGGVGRIDADFSAIFGAYDRPAAVDAARIAARVEQAAALRAQIERAYPYVEGVAVGRPAQPAGPWTRVNNCSRIDETANEIGGASAPLGTFWKGGGDGADKRGGAGGCGSEIRGGAGPYQGDGRAVRRAADCSGEGAERKRFRSGSGT